MKFGAALRHAVLGLVAVTLPLGGCVDDVGTVDRTGPDKIDKRLFEGVWIYVKTTVDVPYSSAISFVGHMDFGEAAKVVFDVQEDWLMAYPVVERVEGTEKEWRLHKMRKYWDPDARDEFIDIYVGAPIAAWPITSHFDVQRSYNTYNGAQGNEVVENTSDRPWYERDYVRVQWHQQGIKPFFYNLGGQVGADSYFVGQDKEGTPDEMTVDVEGGYFDYVIRTLAWSTGQKYCNIYGLSAYDCAKTEVKARHSFRRLDPRRDYEPLRYHNNEHQEKFGYFLTERYAYDQNWGPTYEGKVSWINRWNLWLNTYDFQRPVDAEGNELTVDCFVDSDCDQEVGQRCQKTTSWFETGYCAVPVAKPFKERGLRPIIYHLNTDWHPDYLDAAYDTADNWSDVFKDTVAWTYFYEENGQASIRGCESHADCVTDDLLGDQTVQVLYQGIPCHSSADCAAGSCDSALGFCVEDRACGEGNPCAVGQTCSSSFCHDASGNRVSEVLNVTTVRGSTVVYYGGDNVIVTHDNFADATLDELGGTGNSYVRFINADPAGGSFGLSVGGTSIAGGEPAPEHDYDPQDPATEKWMSVVPAQGGATFSVTQGGTEVAKTIGDVVGGSSYLVIYNGQDVIVSGVSFPDSRYGVRFIHAGANEGKLDYALEGVLLGESVEYKGVTEYENLAGDLQRATVTRSGSRGDITCHQSDTIGRCVGWGMDIGKKALDRVREIKDSLPDMYVLCENQYDELLATDAARMDAREGDARYTQVKEDGSFYNPCGDPELVPHPTQVKKIGDSRYSFFYWINEVQRSGPLGYGPSVADPDTGQIIHAAANIYGGAMHTYGQYAADLINLVNGDLDTSDVITGQWVREYLANKPGDDSVQPDVDTYFGGIDTEVPAGSFEHNFATPGAATLDTLQGVDLTHKLEPPSAKFSGMPVARHMHNEADFPELLEYMRDGNKLLHDLRQQFPPLEDNHFQRRLEKIKGTFIEDLLVTSEIRWAAGHVDPTGELSGDELFEQLSPLSWATKHALRKEEERRAFLSRNNLYMGEFIDDALYGLAKELKDKGLSGPDLRIAVARKVLQGVLEHEVGHTIGLRHNFSGSTDVFNFFDEYYEIREPELIFCQQDGWCDDLNGESCAIQTCSNDNDCVAGLLCVSGECSAPENEGSSNWVPTGVCATATDISCTPTTEDQVCGEDAICGDDGRCHNPREQFVPRAWMTDNEKAQKRTEYQYTTVMDYGGRINSDIHGLGKYDYAAIRFGYGQLVDTYADPSPLRDRVERAAQLYGNSLASWSFYLNSQYWPTRGTGFWHAFQYLGNYIGVEGNLNRIPRPYEQVKYQREMVINDVREYLDLAYVEVPYAMCSDEYRGNMGCYYFDMGIDAGEMSAHAFAQLEQYYIFDAFKRERLFFGSYGNPMSYYARIMDRYLRVLGDVGMYYALWDNFLFRYSWYQEWSDSPLGGRTLKRAALDAFGRLKDTIASPAPGCYKYDDISDSYMNTSFTDGDACELTVPFGVGRFPYTQFGQQLGYQYWQHPLWFGSFWEKLAALGTLTDSTAYFVDTAVGEQLNIGVGTSLGFNTVFPDEMNNFLGGIVSGELDFYAGREVQGAYVKPSIPGREETDIAVQPSLNNFTLKLYAAVYGMAYLPAGFDPTFIDRMAIYLEGEATQFDHEAPGVNPVKFVDPIGGKTYVAYTTNYGAAGEAKVDVGVTMVQRAQQLADEYNEATGQKRVELEQRLNEVREILDVLRQLNHVYGTSALGY